METKEQVIKDIITILISNIEDALTETQEMVSLLGNEKMETKKGKISLNDMFDFSKMDIDGFIAYLFLSKQNQRVFGDLDHELLSALFCGNNPVVPKKMMNALVKSFLK